MYIRLCNKRSAVVELSVVTLPLTLRLPAIVVLPFNASVVNLSVLAVTLPLIFVPDSTSRDLKFLYYYLLLNFLLNLNHDLICLFHILNDLIYLYLICLFHILNEFVYLYLICLFHILNGDIFIPDIFVPYIE